MRVPRCTSVLIGTLVVCRAAGTRFGPQAWDVASGVIFLSERIAKPFGRDFVGYEIVKIWLVLRIGIFGSAISSLILLRLAPKIVYIS